VVTLEPAFPVMELASRVTTIEDGAASSISWTRSPDSWTYRVEGAITVSSAARRTQLSVPDPDLFTGLAFARILADSGIIVRGLVRTVTDTTATLAARRTVPLGEIESRPLADWLFPILNVSQNWFAEMVIKQLGRQRGTAGSWDQGVEVERRFLIDVMRLDSTQFSLEDGSGLSGKNLVTPLTFAKLLDFMRRNPRFEGFARGLPRSGMVGSLERRFVRTPLEGLVQAKSGSIGRVNSLSGYIEGQRGPNGGEAPLCRTFSVQANHHTLAGRTMIDQIDSLVVMIGKDCAKTGKGVRTVDGGKRRGDSP
jgi:D-alanyl-D-alanine carboxypeptidase/D-alanyl-D-alanine-endopeptidase (penicillin-binding protein 4)